MAVSELGARIIYIKGGFGFKDMRTDFLKGALNRLEK